MAYMYIDLHFYYFSFLFSKYLLKYLYILGMAPFFTIIYMHFCIIRQRVSFRNTSNGKNNLIFFT